MTGIRALFTSGHFSPPILALVLLALSPVPATAVPPEVDNLNLTGGGTLRWGFVDEARGYNVYRSTRARLVAGDYGDCLVGSHRTTSLAVTEEPQPGEVHLFLTTAFDETGEGTAGFRTDGAERLPPNPCIPARRHFGFAVNGDPGDGVLDGVAPARNPAALIGRLGAPAVGMFLHTGEVFLSAGDLSSRQKLEMYDWPGEYAARFDGVTPANGGRLDFTGIPTDVWAPITISNLRGSRKSSNGADAATKPSTAGGLGIALENDAGGEERASHGSSSGYRHASPATTPTPATGGDPAFYVDETGILLGMDVGGAPETLIAPGIGGPAWSIGGSPALAHPFLPGIPSGEDCSAIYDECRDYKANGQCAEYGDCCQRYYECEASYGHWSGGAIPCTPCAPIGLDSPPGPPLIATVNLSGVLAGEAAMRTYRSQVLYDGPLGFGWDMDGNERLVPVDGDLVHHDGRGRADLFVRTGPSTFASPPGIYSLLIQNPDGSLTLRDRDGTEHDFHAFDGTSGEGGVEKVKDRNGNLVSFLYDHQGLLTTVVDTLGRSVLLAYDESGRIASITDFAGRRVEYGYDAAGDLVSVRSPAVTGTPNGNDYPSGKLTSYRYSSGFADTRLNHNLLEIVRPNEADAGPPAVRFSYGTGAGAFDLDRVTAAAIGGTNGSGVPAGGTLSFAYQSLNPGQPPDPVAPRRRASVTDRNGNRKEFVLNAAGNLLARTDFTNRDLRPGEPDSTSLGSYNADGELLEVVRPLGNRTLYVFDEASPNRGSQGNVLQIRQVADASGGGGGGRGDGRGGPIADRVWTFAYEPLFNRPLSMTDPRGTDAAYVPQNGGVRSPERYTTRWTYDFQEGEPAANGIAALAARFGIELGGVPLNLGDRNGDGLVAQAGGNPVRTDHPAVRLYPGSNQAAIEGDASQEVTTRFEWNDHGQASALTDAEGNRHAFEHYPETDPDGDGEVQPPPDDGRVLDPATGGYLKTMRVDTAAGPGRNNGTDPAPVAVRYDFRYDEAGNVIGLVDGRGVLTRFIVNALNQVVEARRAAATADASGPDGDPPTGRGEPGLAAFAFKTRFFYDAGDNLIGMSDEIRDATRGGGPFIETTWSYDILGNPLSVSRRVTPTKVLVRQFRYDANGNLVALIQPMGNAHTFSWDERDLPLVAVAGASGPLGGTPSETRHDYDGNGGLIRIADALGNPVEFFRDGFDRVVRTIDQAGNTSDRFFDPLSRTVRLLRRGPVGGPTPGDRSGAGNVDLADTRFLFDELGRLFQVDRSLFVPAGAMPARPPILVEGPLVPGDGSINTRYEYDRLSRLSFVVRDTGATTRRDYDGAGRLLEVTLPAGAETWRMTWDDGHHLIETAETERPSSADGPPAGTFLTTAFHDALGRRTMVVDNAGQTRRFAYDSLDAVVAVSDARGPAGGTILRRSPGNEATSVPVNAHGNVTRFTYDAADRLVSTQRILTPTGEGDGTLSPPPDDDNEFNPDGLITEQAAYSDNSLPIQRIDDRGNVTTYSYDNLNRIATRTGDDGTVTRYTYDARGNLVAMTDPNASRFTYSYDPVNRLVGVGVATGPGVAGTMGQSFEYDGLGRLTLATDGNFLPEVNDEVLVAFVHDSLSRLVEEGRRAADGTALPTTDYGWRAESLLTDLIYPDGRRIAYGYDGAGRLVLVDDLDVTRPEQAAYEYLGTDRVHTRTNAAGVRTTRLDDAGNADVGFDGARRTTLLRHLSAAGTLLAGFEYRYDRESHPASHRRLHHADAGGGNRKGEQYAYDSAGRLISFREGFMDTDHLLVPPPDDDIDWLMDGVSNWNLMTRNGAAYLATPNNMNDYGEPQSGGVADDDGIPDDFHDDAATSDPDGLNLANDANGNLIFDGRHVLHFDAFNRLVRAERAADGAQVAAYTYDALGRRATRVVTNAGDVDESREYRYSFVFQGNAGGVIEERNLDGTVARQVVHEPGGPLWQILAGGVAHYILEDPAGSAAALFAPGVRGGITERVTYDPYGKPQFETPANAPILDGSGRFLPQSQYGNTSLFRSHWYEPELGARADDLNDDWGGLYLHDPDSGLVAVHFGGIDVGLPADSYWSSPAPIQLDHHGWSVLNPGGSSGSGPMPTEQLSFNYGKIEFHYPGYGRGGGRTGRPEAPPYDLSKRHDPNKGRDVARRRCEVPCP